VAHVQRAGDREAEDDAEADERREAERPHVAAHEVDVARGAAARALEPPRRADRAERELERARALGAELGVRAGGELGVGLAQVLLLDVGEARRLVEDALVLGQRFLPRGLPLRADERAAAFAALTAARAVEVPEAVPVALLLRVVEPAVHAIVLAGRGLLLDHLVDFVPRRLGLGRRRLGRGRLGRGSGAHG